MRSKHNTAQTVKLGARGWDSGWTDARDNMKTMWKQHFDRAGNKKNTLKHSKMPFTNDLPSML